MSFDLALFQPTTTPGGFAQQTLAKVGVPGRAIQAEEKLAQRFLVTLLTQLGSIRYQPSEGTNLPNRLKGNNFLTEIDALSVFSASLPAVKVQLQAQENSSMPNNERFASATIIGITVGTDATSVRFQVTSLAGTTGVVTLPLAFGR